MYAQSIVLNDHIDFFVSWYNEANCPQPVEGHK